MTKIKTVLGITTASVALHFVNAKAEILKLEPIAPLSGPLLPTSDPHFVLSVSNPCEPCVANGFGQWGELGDSQFDASKPGKLAVFPTYGSSIVELSRTDGKSFTFNQAYFASVFNNTTGGIIAVKFDEANGSSVTEYRTLQNIPGLQKETFTEPSTVDVQMSSVSTQLFTYQFANPGVNSGVPEPEAWSLMLLGVGAVGGAVRRSAANQRELFAPKP